MKGSSRCRPRVTVDTARLRERRHAAGPDLHAAGHPGRAADGSNVIDNVPDGSYKYDTLQFAFNKRFGSGLFIQSSFDYQWRDELRGGGRPSTTDSTATLAPRAAARSTPIRSPIGYFQNVYPTVVEPAGEHQLAGPRDRPLRLQVRHRRRHQPPRPERLRLLADHRRIAAECRHGRASSPRTSTTTARTRCRFSTSASTRRSGSAGTGSPGCSTRST